MEIEPADREAHVPRPISNPDDVQRLPAALQAGFRLGAGGGRRAVARRGGHRAPRLATPHDINSGAAGDSLKSAGKGRPQPAGDPLAGGLKQLANRDTIRTSVARHLHQPTGTRRSDRPALLFQRGH